MGYALEGGVPIVTSGSNDGFGGMGLGGILIGALLGGNGGLFGGGNRGLAGADLAATAGLQNQMNQLQNQISTLGVNGELNEIENSIDGANIANLQGIAQNALIYSNGNAALQTALAQGNFTTLSSINGLGRDVTAQSNNNALQQLNSFNVLNTTMLQGFNEIGRDTATGLNQIIAGQNAMMAANAACCCELKETIRTDGAMTRALINDINTQNLNTQISDLKSQVNTNAIINALRPVTV